MSNGCTGPLALLSPRSLPSSLSPPPPPSPPLAQSEEGGGEGEGRWRSAVGGAVVFWEGAYAYVSTPLPTSIRYAFRSKIAESDTLSGRVVPGMRLPVFDFASTRIRGDTYLKFGCHTRMGSQKRHHAPYPTLSRRRRHGGARGGAISAHFRTISAQSPRIFAAISTQSLRISAQSLRVSARSPLISAAPRLGWSSIKGILPLLLLLLLLFRSLAEPGPQYDPRQDRTLHVACVGG
eukprot:1269351-Rhodomonas_salina.1